MSSIGYHPQSKIGPRLLKLSAVLCQTPHFRSDESKNSLVGKGRLDGMAGGRGFMSVNGRLMDVADGNWSGRSSWMGVVGEIWAVGMGFISMDGLSTAWTGIS